MQLARPETAPADAGAARRAKTCSKCGISKSRSEFYRQSTSKDGLRGICRSCFQTAWLHSCIRCGAECRRKGKLCWQCHTRAIARETHRQCARCGQTFFMKKGRPRYCSMRCAKLSMVLSQNLSAPRYHPVFFKTCAYCLQLFTARKARTLCCSRRCQNHKLQDAHRPSARAKLKRDSATLSDRYIRLVIADQARKHGAPARLSDIPTPLVEAKREHLRLKRLIKESGK